MFVDNGDSELYIDLAEMYEQSLVAVADRFVKLKYGIQSLKWR